MNPESEIYFYADFYGDVIELKNIKGLEFRSLAKSVIDQSIEGDMEVIFFSD